MNNIKITHGQYKQSWELLSNIQDFIATHMRKGTLRYMYISDEEEVMHLCRELEAVQDLCISIMDLPQKWFYDEEINKQEYIKYGYRCDEVFASEYDTLLLNESQLETLLPLISQLKGDMLYIYYKFINECYNKENFTVAQYKTTTEDMAELAAEVHAICKILANSN